jgi:uncharacterized protein YjbI with pentapeptide repeats
MPRLLQSKFHSDFSTDESVWNIYKEEIVDFFSGANDNSKEDYNDHVIREFNRKVINLGLTTGLLFAPFDAGYRFLANSIEGGIPLPTIFESGVFITESINVVGLELTTSSNYARVNWWDDTSEIYTGDIDNNIDIISPNPGLGGSEKQFVIYSCDANGEPSGYITGIDNNFNNVPYQNKLTNIDFDSCTGLQYIGLYLQETDNINLPNIGNDLTYINLSYNNISSFDVTEYPNLSTLYVGDNPLTSLDLNTETKSLEYLECSRTALTGLNLSGFDNLIDLNVSEIEGFLFKELNVQDCSSLQILGASNHPGFTNPITSERLFTGLNKINLSGCSSLTNLNLSFCDFESFNFDGELLALNTLFINDNPYLSNISISGASLSYYYYTYGGSDLSNCNLDVEALNYFFSGLAESEGGILIIRNNPGSETCDTSIATDKGYIVLNV